jgi:hypothetical protein
MGAPLVGSRPERRDSGALRFKNNKEDVFLIADACEGSQIKSAVNDFLSAAAGINSEKISVKMNAAQVSLAIGGGADLAAYVGHDAFMDFHVSPVAGAKEANCDTPLFWHAQARRTSRRTFWKRALNLCCGQ